MFAVLNHYTGEEFPLELNAKVGFLVKLSVATAAFIAIGETLS